MSGMSVSRSNRMMWVLESLHEAGETGQQRLAVPIPEMIMWSNGRPARWFFSSSDTKVLMRRHSHRLTPEKIVACFKAHALRERQRLGVHSPVAVALSRGKFGVVDAELLDLEGVVNLVDHMDDKEFNKRNLLVLQTYTKPKTPGPVAAPGGYALPYKDSEGGSVDGIYNVQYSTSGRHLVVAPGAGNAAESIETILGLSRDSRLECWHTKGWPRREAFQRTGKCDINGFRSRTLCSAMAALVQRIERVQDVRLRSFACVFYFHAASCIATLVQVQFAELTTDPNIPRGGQWTAADASASGIGGSGTDVVSAAAASAAAAIMEASGGANDNDGAAGDGVAAIGGDKSRPAWRPTSAHNTVRNRPSSAAAVAANVGGAGRSGSRSRPRSAATKRPQSSGSGGAMDQTASRRAHANNQPFLILPGGRVRPQTMSNSMSDGQLVPQVGLSGNIPGSDAATQELQQSASAPAHLLGAAAASEDANIISELRQAEYDIHTAALGAKEDDVAKCCGDYCSNDLATVLGGGPDGAASATAQGMKGVRSKVYRLPFKSVLCARAEDSLLGEGMLGSVASQCMHLAAQCHDADDPFGLGLSSSDISAILGVAERLNNGDDGGDAEPPVASDSGTKAATTSASKNLGGTSMSIPEENTEDLEEKGEGEESQQPGQAGSEAAAAGEGDDGGELQRRLVLEEAVRRAVRRRFTKLDQAWRSEALLQGNGPLTNLKGMVRQLDKHQRKQLAKGVAPLKLWEYEDTARASCYMSALGHLHPARYYRAVPLCACCFILYSSLDDQRSTMDKQRSRERQIIAHAAVVADRKERIEQQHNRNNESVLATDGFGSGMEAAGGARGNARAQKEAKGKGGGGQGGARRSKRGRPPKAPKAPQPVELLEAPDPETVRANTMQLRGGVVDMAAGPSPAVAPVAVSFAGHGPPPVVGTAMMPGKLLVSTATGASPAIVAPPSTVAEQAQALLERGGTSYMVDTACGPSPAVVAATTAAAGGMAIAGANDGEDDDEDYEEDEDNDEEAEEEEEEEEEDAGVRPAPVAVNPPPTPMSDLLHEATERVIGTSQLPSQIDRPGLEVNASVLAFDSSAGGPVSNFAASERQAATLTATPLATGGTTHDNGRFSVAEPSAVLPPAESLRPPQIDMGSTKSGAVSAGVTGGTGGVTADASSSAVPAATTGRTPMTGLPTKGTQVRELKAQLEAAAEREQDLRDQLRAYKSTQQEDATRHNERSETLDLTLSLQREFASSVAARKSASSPNLTRPQPSGARGSSAKAAARCNSTARDKSPHLANGSPGHYGAVSASGEGLVRALEEDDEERLPVDRPLPRRHALLLFDHIHRTTGDVQAGDIKVEIQHREHVRPRHRGGKAVKRSTGPHSENQQQHHSAKRISEPQLSLALRQWRLRRAQKHRHTENQRLVGRVLGALQRCDVTIDEWVDALMTRRLARSVKPIGGHRRGRGQQWGGGMDSGASPASSHVNNLTQADLLKELRQLANTAARHPHSAVHRAELLSMESPQPARGGRTSSPYTDGSSTAGGFKSFNTVSSWVLLPEEMERFVYLLLRRAHDDEHGGGEDGSRKLLSASTLVQPRHLTEMLYSTLEEDEEVEPGEVGGVGASIDMGHGGWSSDDGNRSDSNRRRAAKRKPRLDRKPGRLTKKERAELVDQAFLWLDSYLRLHQLRPANLLRDMMMPAAVERGKYLHTDGIETERNSFQPGAIIDERRRIRSTTGEPPSAVTFEDFSLELCPPKRHDTEQTENRPPSAAKPVRAQSAAAGSRPKSRDRSAADSVGRGRPASSAASSSRPGSGRPGGGRQRSNSRDGQRHGKQRVPLSSTQNAGDDLERAGDGAKPLWDARTDVDGGAWASYNTKEVVRIYDPSKAASTAAASASDAALAAAKTAGALAVQSRRLLDDANALHLGGSRPPISAATTDSFGFDDPRMSQMIAQNTWTAGAVLQDMSVMTATPVYTPETTTTADAVAASNMARAQSQEPILPRRELPLQAYIGV